MSQNKINFNLVNSSKGTVLVTGGTGYIGCHIVVELLNLNYKVVIVDNLSNSNIKVLDRIFKITNQKPTFYQSDIRDKEALKGIILTEKVSAVIHLAALKSVAESVSNPLKYYDNNVNGFIKLLEAALECGIDDFIFSSSATVYGNQDLVPIKESATPKPINPYGFTKLYAEQILQSLAQSNPSFKAVTLRYFNPVGAHESGLIGEDPNGVPNNLMPYITKVAVGELEYLNVFGNDYQTHDGTGIRDYIHVVDLALGHIKALNFIRDTSKVASNLTTFNLGTGMGYSVLDVIKAFETVSGRSIPYSFKPRRAGDVAICYADSSYAQQLIGFEAKRDLNVMCRDSWNWQENNPKGYI